MLRSGRVLRGEIARVGDRYVVAVGENDEVGVSVEVVEMQCVSLEDAYHRKRALLPPDSKVADHLNLADWCLQYDLFACAAEQLMAAQQCDPADPRNESLEKRLRLAVQRPATASKGVESVTPAAVPSDLDEVIRGLPAGTVEKFTNAIQPLLINRCGASNCHGPSSSSSFRLAYPSWSRTLPRRFTQRNLQAAMAFVDREEPQRSPLLARATVVHGGMSKPALSDENAVQLQHLAEWVYLSRGSESPEPHATAGPPEPALLPPGVGEIAPPATVAATGPPSPLPAIANQPAARLDRDIQPASHVSPAELKTESQPASGVDPFDPEVFNRRFGKKSG